MEVHEDVMEVEEEALHMTYVPYASIRLFFA